MLVTEERLFPQYCSVTKDEHISNVEFYWREYQRWMSVLENSQDSETAFTAWCTAGKYWRAWVLANDKMLTGG